MKALLLMISIWTQIVLAGEWVEVGNFKMGIEYLIADSRSPELYGDMGADATKVGLVSWSKVEPLPPKNGIHYYDEAALRALGDFVDRYRSAGMSTIHMVLKCDAPWAVYPVKKNDLVPSSYPLPGNERHYVSFLQHVVRFFMKHGVRHFEIESEAQHDGYWQGSFEQYASLLKMAFRTIKNESADNRVILAGVNLSDTYDDFPSETTLKFRHMVGSIDPLYRKAEAFIYRSLQLTDYYDEVEFHYLRNYTGGYGTVAEIRKVLAKRGVSKPIWAGDSAFAPFFDGKFVPPMSPRQGKEVFQCLDKPRLSCHGPVREQYQNEQARALVKKMIVGMELGLQGIMAGNSQDWPYYANQAQAGSWVYQGFVDDKEGPRPVYYAFKELRERLKTITRMRRVETDRDVYYYEFEGPDRRFFVGWTEKPGSYDLPLTIQIEARNILNRFTSPMTAKPTEKRGVGAKVSLGRDPVYFDVR